MGTCKISINVHGYDINFVFYIQKEDSTEDEDEHDKEEERDEEDDEGDISDESDQPEEIRGSLDAVSSVPETDVSKDKKRGKGQFLLFMFITEIYTHLPVH